MHAFGQAMAIDSGIGYTYDDPNHGPWYKRTKAHNVLMVDDADLDRRAAEGKDVVWTSLKILDFFAATHHGYVKSKGVTHRRHIAFVKPDYFLIYDVAQSQSAETHALSWNLHAPLKIEPAACGFASAGSPGLLVIPSSLAWKQSQSTGPACVIGIRGFKKDYADIPWLRFENSLGPKTSATFAVLLHPFSSSRLKVDFREIGSTHIVVESAGGVDHLLFAASIENDVHFDGACAVLRYADKRLQSWAVSQSKTLVVAGRTLLDSNEPRDAEGSA
jgi:hypothetical protein